MWLIALRGRAQRHCPARLASIALQRRNLTGIRCAKDPVARGPGHFCAAKFAFPNAPTGPQINRKPNPAHADGNDVISRYHRGSTHTAHIGKAGAAGSGQAVAPDHAAIIGAEGQNFAGRKACHHGFARNGGRRQAKRHGQDCLGTVAPKHFAILGGKRQQRAIQGSHENSAIGEGRRAAHGGGKPHTPFHRSVGCGKRQQFGKHRGDKNRIAFHDNASASAIAAFIFRARISAPAPRAIGDVEGRYIAFSIAHEYVIRAGHRPGNNPAPQGCAGAIAA